MPCCPFESGEAPACSPLGLGSVSAAAAAAAAEDSTVDASAAAAAAELCCSARLLGRPATAVSPALCLVLKPLLRPPEHGFMRSPGHVCAYTKAEHTVSSDR